MRHTDRAFTVAMNLSSQSKQPKLKHRLLHKTPPCKCVYLRHVKCVKISPDLVCPTCKTVSLNSERVFLRRSHLYQSSTFRKKILSGNGSRLAHRIYAKIGFPGHLRVPKVKWAWLPAPPSGRYRFLLLHCLHIATFARF